MLPWGNEPNFYCEGYKGMVKVILPICFDVFFAAVEKKKPCSVESHAHPPTSSWEHGPSGPMLKVLEYDKNGLKWIRRVKKKILPAILVFFLKLQMFWAFTDRKTYAPLRILEGFFRDPEERQQGTFSSGHLSGEDAQKRPKPPIFFWVDL